MVAGRALLGLDPPSARKALWSMNLPQRLPRFRLRKLNRRPRKFLDYQNPNDIFLHYPPVALAA